MEKSIKPFVAPKGAVLSLINCLKMTESLESGKKSRAKKEVSLPDLCSPVLMSD